MFLTANPESPPSCSIRSTGQFKPLVTPAQPHSLHIVPSVLPVEPFAVFTIEYMMNTIEYMVLELPFQFRQNSSLATLGAGPKTGI